MFDGRTLKFRCLQAWCLSELEDADTQKGILCIDNEEFVKENTKKICEIIKQNNNTFEVINNLAQTLPVLKPYYDSISKTVGKFFKKGDSYIPAMLILSILQECTLRGHKGFEDIPFIELLEQYDDPKRFKENEAKKHYQCAFEVVDNIFKIKAVKK